MYPGFVDQLLQMLSKAFDTVSEWLRVAAWNVTHDPVWAGVIIALVLFVIFLIYLKRQKAG
jgi:hypothetical protein